jgi:serine/threonine protein kinase
MEWVEGQVLTEIIPAKVGLPANQMVGYSIEIADALAHAHQHGVMHRDLKSGNVMVCPDGLNSCGTTTAQAPWLSSRPAGPAPMSLTSGPASLNLLQMHSPFSVSVALHACIPGGMCSILDRHTTDNVVSYRPYLPTAPGTEQKISSAAPQV